jgi:hydrogenase maturation protease
VLALLRDLGGGVERVLVVGCAPATVDERMGLSEPVAAAVDAAVELVMDVVGSVPAR